MSSTGMKDYIMDPRVDAPEGADSENAWANHSGSGREDEQSCITAPSCETNLSIVQNSNTKFNFRNQHHHHHHHRFLRRGIKEARGSKPSTAIENHRGVQAIALALTGAVPATVSCRQMPDLAFPVLAVQLLYRVFSFFLKCLLHASTIHENPPNHP